MNHATLGNREKINAKSLSSTYSELKELHSCQDEKPQKKNIFLFSRGLCLSGNFSAEIARQFLGHFYADFNC